MSTTPQDSDSDIMRRVRAELCAGFGSPWPWFHGPVFAHARDVRVLALGDRLSVFMVLSPALRAFAIILGRRALNVRPLMISKYVP